MTEMEKIFKFDAFLSFSNMDIGFARDIWEEMQKHGLKVFFSDETLKSNIGHSFFSEIDSALSRSKNFVLICSPSAMNSAWVRTEYEAFFNEYTIKNGQQRRLIILKGNNFDISIVPHLLRRLQIANSVNDVINTLKIDRKSEKIIGEDDKQKKNNELIHISEFEEKKEEMDLKDKSERAKSLTSVDSTNEIIRHLIGIPTRETKKKRSKFVVLGGIIIGLIVVYFMGLLNTSTSDRAAKTINSNENKQVTKDGILKITNTSIPRRIKYIEPICPTNALKANILPSTVYLNVTTDIYGRVISVTIISGHPLLRKAALDAAKSWVYEPYILNGEPKSVTFFVGVEVIPKHSKK